MEQLNVALAVIGLLAVVLGLFTNVIRLSFLSKPILATAAGIAVGPIGLGWLDLQGTGHGDTLLEQVARFTLVIVLIHVGVQLPRGYLRRTWDSISILTAGAMVLMWLLSSLLIWGILRIDPLMCLLIGAVITPTDPVVAGSIVRGKLAERFLAPRTRNILMAESGANDGLAYLFVLLPILLMQKDASEAWWHWLSRTLLWEVLLAIAVGVVLGYLAGKAENWSAERHLSDRGPLMTVMLALALAITGIVRLLGSDEILSVFAAGVMLGAVRTEIEEQQGHMENVIEELFQLPIFVLIGTMLPWDKWHEMGWVAVLLVAAVLVFRRVPVLLVLKPMLREIPRWDEALFIGWFGPIGVAAVYYAALAHRHVHDEFIWTVASLIIFASIVAHGVTATLFTRLLGQRERPVLFHE